MARRDNDRTKGEAAAGSKAGRKARRAAPWRELALALTVAVVAAGLGLVAGHWWKSGEQEATPSLETAPALEEAGGAPPAPKGRVDLGDARWTKVAPPAGETPAEGGGAAPSEAPADLPGPETGASAAAPGGPETAASAPARRPAPPPRSEARPMIAIVIDDLGLDRHRTAEVTVLRAPLTLSFLPYATDLPQQARAARAAGHELLVHLPMEPESAIPDPGPNALMTGLARPELLRRLAWNLGRFEGFVGINNHMGSRFTRDVEAMTGVLTELKARRLLFLDSRTTPETVGARIAGEIGLPYGERDMFLDNERTADEVRARLAALETVARRQGYAIAIGHPHRATLESLAAWLPTLDAKGLVQVSVSTIVRRLRPEEPGPSAARPEGAG